MDACITCGYAEPLGVRWSFLGGRCNACASQDLLLCERCACVLGTLGTLLEPEECPILGIVLPYGGLVLPRFCRACSGFCVAPSVPTRRAHQAPDDERVSPRRRRRRPPKRRRKHVDLVVAEQMFEAGDSRERVAERFGVSITTLRSRYLEAGLEAPVALQPHRLFRTRQD